MAKSALVTGGSEGIGKAFVERLAKDGYQVTVVARSETKLRELTSRLGKEHKYIVADLSSREGQEKIMEVIEKAGFDLLINNAGVGTVGGFTDVPYDKQLAMFHLNCEALVKLSYTYLKNAKTGDALINVSSALAFMPTPSMALYCATKSFVTALSDSLWYEQKKRGVYVMGLCPGITETQFQVSAGGRKEDLPKGLSQTPDQVVDVAIQALASRRNPTIVSGIKNAIFAGVHRVLPRRALVTITGGMMPSGH
jgi:short-subunit dehydrogenase